MFRLGRSSLVSCRLGKNAGRKRKRKRKLERNWWPRRFAASRSPCRRHHSPRIIKMLAKNLLNVNFVAHFEWKWKTKPIIGPNDIAPIRIYMSNHEWDSSEIPNRIRVLVYRIVFPVCHAVPSPSCPPALLPFCPTRRNWSARFPR